ncbi:hypothetical protein [Yinghuangia seranimata]|uniref:hypothetical protein n=1 Tax=Yinghuangia seranimata TaxID=408067 RepID=UPI00248C9DCB|nr:hypothetical protein [Yinghuangia seranimata]MDI2130527.1 hypothetical protein [Yinghuangia seranimata]
MLVRCVLDAGSTEDRAELAGNGGCGPEVLASLAEFGEPRIAVELYHHPFATREVMLRAMASTSVSELKPFESQRFLDKDVDAQRRLYPLVELDDADLTATTFKALDWRVNFPGLSAVILRGCLGLLGTVGADATRAAASGVIARLPPNRAVPDVVREAFADPGDAVLVKRALEHERSMPVIIDRMADHDYGPRAVDLLLVAPREPLDWTLLAKAHRAKPFNIEASLALTHQHGCPPELRSRLFAPSPRSRFGMPLMARRARRRLPSLSTGLTNPNARTTIHVAHRKGLLPAAAILAEGAPAIYTLMVFRSTQQDRMRDVRAALSAITRTTLGDQVEAWSVALGLLAGFTGTTPELCEVARAMTA